MADSTIHHLSVSCNINPVALPRIAPDLKGREGAAEGLSVEAKKIIPGASQMDSFPF